MEMHGAGGLAQIAVAAKEAFQGFDQGAVPSRVGVEQWAECFLVKFDQFALTIKAEEQAIDAQIGKRVQPVLAKEPPSNL